MQERSLPIDALFARGGDKEAASVTNQLPIAPRRPSMIARHGILAEAAIGFRQAKTEEI
jgi:hypothetical protein